MKYIREANLKNKKVLLRVDFNVPMDSKRNILDDARIKATLPTIKYLQNSKAKKIYIVSHLGEPIIMRKEKIDKIILGNKNLVLKPIVENLAKWLKIQKKHIKLINIKDSPLPGYELSDQITVLENIRFLSGEKKNDKETARSLSLLADIFVNDAFGVLHRTHASVCEITNFLPSYAGLLVEKEFSVLEKIINNPARPLVMILGGAKIKDKMLIIKKMSKKADFFLLGGVMANTFLATRNINVKQSLVEKERLDLARELMNKSARKIILPTGLVWYKNKILDIDQNTVNQFARYIKKAKTIFFNGTMGFTTKDRFRKGTLEILKIIIQNKSAQTIICGGDTIAEVNRQDLQDKFFYISTGGGVTLNYLAGEKLPGLEALNHPKDD